VAKTDNQEVFHMWREEAIKDIRTPIMFITLGLIFIFIDLPSWFHGVAYLWVVLLWVLLTLERVKINILEKIIGTYRG